MRDSEVLENNPRISQSALEALHEQVFSWAHSRCDYDRGIAEDIVQQAYVELLTGRARFEERSSLKTFVFAVVQNLSRGRYRRIASRLRLAKAVSGERVEGARTSDELAVKNVWQAVQQLPDRQRDVIELVFCRDMTISDASAHRHLRRFSPRQVSRPTHRGIAQIGSDSLPPQPSQYLHWACGQMLATT